MSPSAPVTYGTGCVAGSKPARAQAGRAPVVIAAAHGVDVGAGPASVADGEERPCPELDEPVHAVRNRTTVAAASP